jgi:uncharacterized protein (TIGR03067 family)
LKPGEIDFGLIHQGQSPSKFMDVEYAGSFAWAFSEIIKSSSAPFDLKVEELKSSAFRGYRIRALIRPDAPAGPFKQEVLLKTKGPANRTLTLTFNVLGHIQADHAALPPFVDSAQKTPFKGTDQAERDLAIARFYDRTGHLGSAAFYYELICKRYPNTTHGKTAALLLQELRQRGTPPPPQKAPTRIGQIIIVGNDYIPDAIIRGSLELYPGQLLNLKDLRAAHERLNRLNKEGVDAFFSIQILNPDSAREYKDILVQVSQTLPAETLIEMKKLEGSWIVTAASGGGTKVPALTRAELVFSGGEIKITQSVQRVTDDASGATTTNQHTSRHSFLLNSSSDPKGIRLFPVDGPPNARSSTGSYELRNDGLRLRLRADAVPGRDAGHEPVMELTLKRKKANEP